MITCTVLGMIARPRPRTVCGMTVSFTFQWIDVCSYQFLGLRPASGTDHADSHPTLHAVCQSRRFRGRRIVAFDGTCLRPE